MRAYAYALTELSSMVARLRDRLDDGDAERGDVPGWVMITVMTAALVLAILVPLVASGRAVEEGP